jgi:RNA polymerase sigma-70 factor, ECF subfamily
LLRRGTYAPERRVSNNLEEAYELTLVLRSQMGDDAAFAELFRKYSPRLRYYVTKMLGDRHDQTDDVLQEIWTSVFRALPKLNDGAAFRAWLFQIARTRVCREFREARMDSLDRFDKSQMEEVATELESPVDREAVQQQLAGLSPEHREALVLRFIEGMSYEEIARVTGQSPGTVRSRIHYAKRALRRAWKENSYEIK